MVTAAILGCALAREGFAETATRNCDVQVVVRNKASAELSVARINSYQESGGGERFNPAVIKKDEEASLCLAFRDGEESVFILEATIELVWIKAFVPSLLNPTTAQDFKQVFKLHFLKNRRPKKFLIHAYFSNDERHPDFIPTYRGTAHAAQAEPLFKAFFVAQQNLAFYTRHFPDGYLARQYRLAWAQIWFDAAIGLAKLGKGTPSENVFVLSLDAAQSYLSAKGPGGFHPRGAWHPDQSKRIPGWEVIAEEIRDQSSRFWYALNLIESGKSALNCDDVTLLTRDLESIESREFDHFHSRFLVAANGVVPALFEGDLSIGDTKLDVLKKQIYDYLKGKSLYAKRFNGEPYEVKPTFIKRRSEALTNCKH